MKRYYFKMVNSIFSPKTLTANLIKWHREGQYILEFHHGSTLSVKVIRILTSSKGDLYNDKP